ncbi:HNH endonuclease [Mitsuaria sp. TWR114]|uniref:HNH endonuclease n=1 Tax=Mitsuaria sp. TWR114 TaxID=2601731 RepID=UPI0011BF6BC7|nr:HNH endonuclease [Mitsuaria sp. TWR114]TXD99425.1 HNH endonuclease [Mitsuaria sp. TWR114]
MTPVDRLRIEKAAADCGFEMSPVNRESGVELRSARFPESVVVYLQGEDVFRVAAANARLLHGTHGEGDVSVQGWAALYDVLRIAAAHARTLPNRVADAFRAQTARLPKSTEAERVVVQRVGQNLFRAALLDYWLGRCCVTGLEIPELLRASHIKPWATCENDDERLDVFNGLLLTPSLDALFDAGWVTFSPEGNIRLSPALSQQAQVTLGVTPTMTVRQLRSEHQPYLDHHRRRVFRHG